MDLWFPELFFPFDPKTLSFNLLSRSSPAVLNLLPLTLVLELLTLTFYHKVSKWSSSAYFDPETLSTRRYRAAYYAPGTSFNFSYRAFLFNSLYYPLPSLLGRIGREGEKQECTSSFLLVSMNLDHFNDCIVEASPLVKPALETNYLRRGTA